MVSKPEQIADPIETFDYCDAEIVIGLVCAVGTDYGPIRDSLKDILARYGYKCRVVRISDSIPKFTDYPLRGNSLPFDAPADVTALPARDLFVTMRASYESAQ